MADEIEKIEECIQILDKKFTLLFGDNVTVVSVTDYVAEFNAYGNDRYYNYFSYELIDIFGQIRSIYGESGVNLFHKYALALNTRQALVELKVKNYPLDINSLYRQWIERVIGDFFHKDDSFYSSENDLYVKDMGVVSFRIIPAGAQILCISGVARSFLKSWNPISIIRNAWFMISKMKGTRPFIEIHTDNRWLHEFNPEGWNRCYLRIAYYLKEHPEIKGMAGGSWFYDPKLAVVSPHLAYLRKIPKDNGAGVFKIETTENCRNDSLFSSNKRRKLYENGEYEPSRYLVIWCRDDLINWAESYETNKTEK